MACQGCDRIDLVSMQVRDTPLRDVKLLKANLFGDSRGWFAEFFSERTFEAAGLPTRFVQDNQSTSRRGILRGLHFQLGRPQGKLVRVLSGEIWDVAVDVRRSSAEFGRWAAFPLKPVSEDGQLEMLWIPVGYAHGFLVLSETAEVLYKVTDFYDPASERTVRWNDPELGINWPIAAAGAETPELSEKDAHGLLLRECDLPE